MAALAAAFLAGHAQPLIGAKSAIVIDADSGVVLYQRDARASRFPASTTKVLTALLLLENTKPGEMLTAPADCDKVTGASLHLVPGETITREDALFALMLRSANDVAHMVAVKVSASDEKFSELMNSRAKELGCVNSSFHNPHGLNDDKHSTCAYDLALITREAMKNELFRKAVSCQKWTVVRSVNTLDCFLTNHDKLLWHDPQMEGVKTGYTVPAGHCFVGAKSMNGWRLISVVLASKDWKGDTKALFDYAFSTFERHTPVPAGLVGEAPVTGGNSLTVPAKVERAVSVVSNRGGYERPSIVWHKVAAPVSEGEKVGVIRARAVGGAIVEEPIVAAASVSATPIAAIRSTPWYLWLLAAPAAGMAFLFYRIKRPRNAA